MLRRELKLDQDIDLDQLPAHLADCLRHVHGDNVKIENNRTSFAAGAFGPLGSSSFLVSIGFGDLTVNSNPRQIEYRLSFRRLLVGATLIMSCLAVVVWFSSHSWETIRALAFMWMALVGFNFVYALSRFQEFLSDALRTAPRLK